MKKVCLLSALCILGILFFIQENSKASGSASSKAEQFPVLKVLFCDEGRDMSDAPLVNEAINQYLEPELGIHVDIEYLPSSNYPRIVSQKFLAGETIDLLYCQNLNQVRYQAQEGWLEKLDSLADSCGDSFRQLFSEEYLRHVRVNGSLYALPSYRDQGYTYGIEYNRSIADECGIDMTQITAFDDLTPVFEKIHDMKPDIIPFVSDTVAFSGPWDILGDELGVLMNLSDSTVSNLYETPEFSSFSHLMYSWNQAGYVWDTLTYSSTTTAYLASGNIFCSFIKGKPDISSQESRITGMDLGYIPLVPAQATSEVFLRGFTAISSSSRHKEKAMQLIDRMYSDPVLANLIVYGIEGIHYEFTDETHTSIRFPKGMTVRDSHYAKLITWQYCNQSLTIPWEGNPPDIWEQVRSFNETAARSIAYGFQFDNTPVAEKMAACQNLRNLYRNGLLYGHLDPDVYIPVFLSKLREAGLEDIILEKQRQLDRWLEGEKNGSSS